MTNNMQSHTKRLCRHTKLARFKTRERLTQRLAMTGPDAVIRDRMAAYRHWVATVYHLNRLSPECDELPDEGEHHPAVSGNLTRQYIYSVVLETDIYSEQLRRIVTHCWQHGVFEPNVGHAYFYGNGE